MPQMARFLNPWRCLQMLRHSRGFGIHSPFAYRFITEVIHQPYAYYAYARIAGSTERLLFRVLVDLAPRRIAVYGPSEWGAAAKAARPHAAVTPRRPDFVAADFGALSADERKAVIEALRQGASFFGVGLSPNEEAKIKASMPQGMTFANARGTLIAAVRKLPRQDFELLF